MLGGWENVDSDSTARGLAAYLATVDGTVLRVVGVYVVSGVSLQGLEASQQRLSAERRLLKFVRKQVSLAVSHGWLLVIMGDLNSVVDPALDV